MLPSLSSSNTKKQRSLESLREDFYRIVYLSALDDLPRISVCAYCGRSIDEKCSCGNNSMKNCGFIDFSHQETLDLVDIFIEWADTNQEKRTELIKKYCYDRITVINIPELLNQNFPEQIFLFVVRFVIENPPLYYKFTKWIDSEIFQKRMIFYFIVLRSKDKDRIDTVFSRLTEDLEVYNILKPLQIFICPPSNKVFIEVLDKVGKEKDPERIKQFSLNLLLVDPPTLEIEPSLLSKLLRPFNLNIIDFKPDTIYLRFVKKVIEIITKSEFLKKHNYPIQDYDEIIIYSFYALENHNDQNILDELYEYYGENFKSLVISYLENIFKTDIDGAIDQIKVKIIFEHMIMLQDKYKLDIDNHSMKSNIDKLIYNQISLRNSTRYKLFDYIKNYEAYLEVFIEDDSFQPPNCPGLAFYYLFNKLPSNFKFPNEYLKYFDKILATDKTFHCYLLIFKYFQDNNSLMKRFDCIDASDFEKYDFLGSENNICDPINIDLVFEFERLLVKRDHNILKSSFLIKKFQRYFCSIMEKYATSGYYIKDILERLKKYGDIIVHYFQTYTERAKYITSTSFFSALFTDETITQTMLESTPKTKEIIIQHQKSIIDSCLASKITNIYQIKMVVNFGSLDNDVGYTLIADNYKNFRLLEKLFDLYDSPNNELSKELEKFCEISLKLNVIKVALPTQTSAVTEIVKRNYSSPLSDLYKDIQIKFSSSANSSATVYDQYLIHDHLDEFLDKCKFCIKSRYFKEFYFNLPLKETISPKHITYLLELEERKYRQELGQIPIVTRENELDQTNNLYKLPHIILKKIIHYVYHDLILHYQFKIILATVSKTFFNLCSSILTNHYYEDFLNNYITIRVTKKINIHSPFSLFNDYPKYLEYKSLKYISMDMNKIDSYFYEYLESLYINLTNNIFATRLLVTRNTNLKIIEMEFVKGVVYSNPEKVLKLIKHSPLLERLNITSSLSWNGFNEFVEEALSYQLTHLKDFTIYLNHVADHPPIYITDIKANLKSKQNQIKFPKFYLRSIPNSVPFDGFEYANIRFTSGTTEIVPGVLATLNQVRLSIENINQVVPIILMINQYPNINNVSFRLYKHSVEPIEPIQIQNIFDLLSPSIKVFSIYFATFLTSTKISLLSENQWKRIDIKDFLAADCVWVQYYRP